MMDSELGLEVVPVWNKSKREHLVACSQPRSVKETAESGVEALELVTRSYGCESCSVNFEGWEALVIHVSFGGAASRHSGVSKRTATLH